MALANSEMIDIETIIEKQQQLLAAEFFGAQFESKIFARNLYRDTVTQAAVDRFRAKSTQWVQLPGDGARRG